MKNVLKSLALVAVSTLAVVSCQKNELAGQNDGEGVFFSLRTGETKTYIVQDGNKYLPNWAKGDEIGVFFDEFTKEKTAPAGKLTNSNESGNAAKFEGTISSAPESGTIYAFYPSSALGKTYDGQSIGFDMPSVQHPTATSFDPAADILVAKPVGFTATDGVVNVENMYFARILATLKVNLNSDFADVKNKKVSSFKLEATEATLSGRAAVSMKDANGKITVWNTESKTVSATYDETSTVAVAGEYNSVFVTINPKTITAGETITFTIETEGYIITKAIALTSDIVLTPGNLTEINLGIVEENCEKKVAETRIWVENFDKVTEVSQATPGQTGAAGTGVSDNLTYTYSTNNTNVRVNNNGHGSGNPFLWISGANEHLQISNIAVSGETDLKFSCQVKTTQSTADVTLKYKASTAEEWITADGKISATTSSINTVQSLIFTISEDVTSLDLQIVGSAGYLVVDDIVLEKFVDQRTQLNVPANVKAEADATTSNKVNVTWDAVENAGSYEVTLQTSGEEDVVETVETNSISFTGLKYSTQYSVKVKAISSDVALYKDSEYSATVGVTTGAQPAVMIYFEKITSTDQIVDNEEYLIVHSTDAIFDGSRGASTIDGSNNYIEITSSDVTTSGISYDTYKNYCVYIASMEGGYSFKTKGGVYFGRTSDSNGFNTSTTSAIASTLSFDAMTSAVIIKGTGTSTKAFGYLSGKFRFYAASNAKDIYLYKKADPRTALATPEITVTPDNTAKKITVTWNVVANAANYTVTCGQAEKTETGTSCEFTGLEYGDYTVTVQANPAAGSTAYRSSGKASKNVSIVDTTPVINASNPAAVEATATSVEVSYTVTNKVEGNNLTAVVTTGDWISNPQVAADKVTFTLSANTTSEQRNGTVTLSYVGAADKVVTITQKGAGQTGYASLEDLVAAGEPKSGVDAENVTVTFSNKKIIEIQGNRKGIWLSVAGAPNDKIEIYPNVVMPEDWVVGGIVTATLTNCKWVKYNASTWELCPTDWSEISYIGPCATPVITLDGAEASISCATEGATILYEISDTEPTSFTHTYSSAVTLEDGQTIWAKATLAGHPDSDVASKKYTAGGGATSYEEYFSKYSNTGQSASAAISEFSGDACKWSGVGATTAFYSNTVTTNTPKTGVTLLKGTTYLISEELDGGVTNIELIAHSNNTGSKVDVYVVVGQKETKVGTVSTTTKKKDFSGKFTVTGVTGKYKLKIANGASGVAYVNFSALKWNNN